MGSRREQQKNDRESAPAATSASPVERPVVFTAVKSQPLQSNFLQKIVLFLAGAAVVLWIASLIYLALRK